VHTKYGAVFYLIFEKAFCLLLKACNLHELATTTAVKITLSVDGADLFKGRTHVSTGVKITDEQAVHPVTKQPLAVCNVDLECIEYIKLQSSDVCCIMMIADAVDSKQLYEDVIKDFYEWGNNLQLNGLPASDLGPKLMPFQVLFTNDLKATWYLSNKGGGCKNKTHFCHLCACTKDSITSFTIDNDRCSRCKANCRLRCFHTEVCNRVHVSNLLDDLEKQLGSYYEKHGRHYHDIMKQSKLLTDHMQVDRELDRNHIDYVVPPFNNERQKEYANFIACECILHGIKIDASDNFEDWRSILHMSVSMEKYIFFSTIFRNGMKKGGRQ
jgi:hypothetical protein